MGVARQASKIWLTPFLLFVFFLLCFLLSPSPARADGFTFTSDYVGQVNGRDTIRCKWSGINPWGGLIGQIPCIYYKRVEPDQTDWTPLTSAADFLVYQSSGQKEFNGAYIKSGVTYQFKMTCMGQEQVSAPVSVSAANDQPPGMGDVQTGGGSDDAGGSSSDTGGQSTDTEGNDNNNQNQQQDKGGMFEQIVAGVVNVPCTVIQNLFKSGGFKSLDKLVFMQGYTDDQKRNLPWEGNEPDLVRTWFEALVLVPAPFFIIAVVATGFKLLYAAVNPAARAEAMESIQRWFLAVGIVALAPLVISTLMWITSIAVDAVSAAFQAVASSAGLSRSVSDWSGVTVDGIDIVTGSVLGTVCVRLFLALMFGYLNVLYIVRKVVLTVMFAFTPIMALLWALNKNSTAAMIWLGEIASNAFMPLAHALVLCTILLICDVKITGNGSWLTIIIMLYALIPAAEMIRNSLQSLIARLSGMSEERTATGAFFAALGMGGVMSLGRLGAATIGGGFKPRLDMGGDIGGSGVTPPVGCGPIPVQQSGLQPSTAQSATSDQGGPPAASYAQSIQGSGTLSPQASFAGGMAPNTGMPSINSMPRTGGMVPQRAQPVPGRHERAVNFGMAVGRVAAMGASALLGTAAGAVPGAERAVAPIAHAVSAVTRIAATGAHLVGSHAINQERLQKAAKDGSLLAQGTIRAGQKMAEATSLVTSHPAAQRVASVGQKVSMAVHSGVNPEKAIQRARYLDRHCDLDRLRER